MFEHIPTYIGKSIQNQSKLLQNQFQHIFWEKLESPENYVGTLLRAATGAFFRQKIICWVQQLFFCNFGGPNIPTKTGLKNTRLQVSGLFVNFQVSS